jgi:multisubunit Na+/H+ antiporter MnhG subunit
MRYFLLLPFPVTLLSGGIVEATGASGLVLLPGPFERFLAGSTTATTGAIALATVTLATDNDLGVAATTLVEAAG